MASAAALLKDMGQRKLSPDKETPSPKGSNNPFQRGRLVQELLSLGNEKITPRVARKIGKEVEEDLNRHPRPRVTPELISELVAFKLEEMGLIPNESGKKLKNTPNEDETVSFSAKGGAGPVMEPNRTQGLLTKGQNTTLPTLEKFLKPIAQEEKPAEPQAMPPPPRTLLQVHPEALAELGQKNSERKTFEELGAAVNQIFKNISQAAASAERQFPSQSNVETLAVEFYNTMANQEFYPHFTGILGDDRSQAYGGHQVWIDLPAGSASTTAALADAKEIWKQGGCVSFQIDSEQEAGEFTLESFEKFLHDIEMTILELPGSIPIPRMVGLHFNQKNPLAQDLAALALSGKYYPKFNISLALSEDRSEPLPEILWHKCSPQFIFSDHLRYSTSEAKELPRWGGGPLLAPYEVCHLGSLNLAILASGNDVDWLKLRRMVRTAVHFLDNLFEVTEYPLESIAAKTRSNRKIGLGVMGFAELLAKLGTPYDSDQALSIAEKIMRFVNYEAMQASQGLARERGVFPDYALSPWKEKGVLVRNATLNGAVPAPFIAKLAGVTPGISTFESVLEESHDNPLAPAELRPLALVKRLSLQRKIWNPSLEGEILAKGSVRNSELAPQALRRLIANREEISPVWQARVQGAWQKHCEGIIGNNLEISETQASSAFPELLKWVRELQLPMIQLKQSLHPEAKDFPREATISEAEAEESTPIQNLEAEILEAGEVTEVVDPEISTAAIEEKVAEEETLPPEPVLPRPRPEVLTAKTRQMRTPEGLMTLSLSFDELGPYELTARLGKSGSTENVHGEALSRLISLLLGIGVEPKQIYEELVDLRGPQTVQDQGEEILSVPDALAKFLDRECQLISNQEESLTIEEEEEVTEALDEGFQGEYFEKAEEDVTEVVDVETLH